MKRLMMALCVSLSCVSQTWAFGLSQLDASASASGMANAAAASSQDISLLAYNPAGLSWLEGSHGMIGSSWAFRDSSVTIPGGGMWPNHGSISGLPVFFVGQHTHGSNWGFGFSSTTPYAWNNQWPTVFADSVQLTRMKVFRQSFDVSYAVSSSLSVNAGLDWYVNRAAYASPSNAALFKDDKVLSGHVSLMWRPVYDWSLGVVARVGRKLQLKSPAAQTLNMYIPDELTLAASYQLADQWRWEADAVFKRWSAWKAMDVRGGLRPEQTALKLRDTLDVMTGLVWSFQERTQLRFGYAYSQSANKKSNYQPRLADWNGQRLSLGAGLDLVGVHFDGSYAYTFLAPVNASGTYAGRYRNRDQTYAASVSVSF